MNQGIFPPPQDRRSPRPLRRELGGRNAHSDTSCRCTDRQEFPQAAWGSSPYRPCRCRTSICLGLFRLESLPSTFLLPWYGRPPFRIISRVFLGLNLEVEGATCCVVLPSRPTSVLGCCRPVLCKARSPAKRYYAAFRYKPH